MMRKREDRGERERNERRWEGGKLIHLFLQPIAFVSFKTRSQAERALEDLQVT